MRNDTTSDDMMIVPATIDDIDEIVAMTRATRRQLASWAPTYFHPAEGADELHAGFLRFIVDSADHTTQIVLSKDRIVGFFVEVEQSTLRWVDDLSTKDAALWPDIIEAVAVGVEGPWATCVSTSDSARIAALAACGLTRISSYWARSLGDISSGDISSGDISTGDLALAEPIENDPTAWPRHTFGGRPFDPALPGALVLTTNEGFVVGSPSATPPIYDPGGPTAVVDRVVGTDRGRLVEGALAAAAGRGDAQLVIVTGVEDDELARIAESSGFSRVVDFIGRPSQTSPEFSS